MTRWVTTDTGTYYRQVARSRKDRRCEECRRLLPAGRPYTEHRATMWAEFVADGGGGAYSIYLCGPKTSDCSDLTPPQEPTDAR